MDLVVATFVAFMEHRVLPGEIPGEHPSVLTELNGHSQVFVDDVDLENLAPPPQVTTLPLRFCMAVEIARKCTPTLPASFPPTFTPSPKICLKGYQNQN